MNHNNYLKFSILFLLLGLGVWIPNFIFDFGTPLTLIAPLLGAIGLVFAVLSKSLLLIIGNSLVMLSFFLIMGLGYYYYANV